MPKCICDDGTPSGFTPTVQFGVWGDSGTAGPFGGGGNGAIGSSKNSSGVFGVTLADNNRAAGVFGTGPWVGLAGAVTGAASAPASRVGVYGAGGRGRGTIGVQGDSDSGVGVSGNSRTNRGVDGSSVSAPGVAGTSQRAAGVLGTSQTTGVLALGNDTGLVSIGGTLAGLFFGNVQITGSLSKGGGGFKIDHPLAPGEKYLEHSFVESSEMKNIYDGIAVCNKKGEAVVNLPKWFESLNSDFRYQLTPIGAPGPNLFIAEPVKNGRFKIAGGSSGLEVSWQVTGVRKDAWAQANRFSIEQNKSRNERGRYLHPEALGKSSESGLSNRYRELAETPKAEGETKSSKRR
ncbi:MAG TPA: hypothetical protein VLB46_22975 [Pyrinomonadaceae bacterium]|nr:hypothetical protein [Pyrinomonadaceae bacterium]